MKPRTALALVSAVSIAWVAFAVAIIWPTPARGQPATAASAPAIVPTACGEAGVGRLVGRAEPVARSASEAAGSFVNSDGYWSSPCPTPPPPPAPPADCQPAKPDTVRTWTADGLTCTASAPPTDRTIAHGRSAGWMAAAGATRGILVEHCTDGVRTRIGATCTQATSCGTHVEATRAGRVYVYDAPGTQPLGARVTLRAADGATWPATCVAGAWDVPPILPRAPAVTPDRPAVVAGCRPGVWSSAGRYYRYDGPIQPAGAVIQAQGLMGAQPAQFVCDGSRWAKPATPIAPRTPTGETAAEEWLRIFNQLEQGRRP